jgi:hypothetical protein
MPAKAAAPHLTAALNAFRATPGFVGLEAIIDRSMGGELMVRTTAHALDATGRVDRYGRRTLDGEWNGGMPLGYEGHGRPGDLGSQVEGAYAHLLAQVWAMGPRGEFTTYNPPGFADVRAAGPARPALEAALAAAEGLAGTSLMFVVVWNTPGGDAYAWGCYLAGALRTRLGLDYARKGKAYVGYAKDADPLIAQEAALADFAAQVQGRKPSGRPVPDGGM